MGARGCSGGEIQEMDSRQLNGQVLCTGVVQYLIVKSWSIIIMYFCLLVSTITNISNSISVYLVSTIANISNSNKPF